ncbi:cation diffusion facilitator family transporter [Mizugakiibacter sediminis]|uniref:Cation diffusion facilitator family transporter n=1 Tax=Mizugakiibacter sediminis TaxID=1475481 RepID=A0A0K8QM05_9GAMM|nr:cation diffusion facilitator family transporter [Mizugakiibacter sediminis]GAP65955.1 cation diffusion facilitator family transporter [Mizugakiibacter sediminis]
MNARHSHAHAHGHDHAHGRAPTPRGERKLLAAFALTVAMLAGEAAGGWWSGSLALLADAGHMLVDAAALLLAFLGARFARRPADARRSFGYARLEVLAGFVNALVQLALVAWIVFEAAMRLRQPQPILSGVMLTVALLGLLVNALVLRSLHGHDADDVNAAGARLHVFGDLLGSVAAIAAALLVRYAGWPWADPLLSLLVSLLILRSAWSLLRRSAHILLEGVPEGVEPQALAAALHAADPGVADIHHLHVWQIASGSRMATLHARVCEGADAHNALLTIKRVLRERYGIAHATVQIEAQECVDRDHACHESGRRH